MKHHITKLCADSLRAFLNAEYGINLKSGHSHEIVAAIFGYNSSIALRKDTSYPVSKLEQTEFIVMDPEKQLLEDRLQCLKELPDDFPPSEVLVECIYSLFTRNQELSKKVQPSFRELAISIANEPIHGRLKEIGISASVFKWKGDVEIQKGVSEVAMTVSFEHLADSGKRSRYGKVEIKLPRVAGKIGYGMPVVRPTFYTGRFTDSDFNPDFGFKSGRLS